MSLSLQQPKRKDISKVNTSNHITNSNKAAINQGLKCENYSSNNKKEILPIGSLESYDLKAAMSNLPHH